MRCPYCEAEMEAGYLNSSSNIFYSKDDSGYAPGRRFALETGPMRIAFHGVNVEASYCEACKKIIIDVEGRQFTNVPGML